MEPKNEITTKLENTENKIEKLCGEINLDTKIEDQNSNNFKEITLLKFEKNQLNTENIALREIIETQQAKILVLQEQVNAKELKIKCEPICLWDREKEIREKVSLIFKNKQINFEEQYKKKLLVVFLENLISSILAAMSTQLNDMKSDKITIPISDVKRWESNNLLLTKDIEEKKQKLAHLEATIINKEEMIIKCKEENEKLQNEYTNLKEKMKLHQDCFLKIDSLSSQLSEIKITHVSILNDLEQSQEELKSLRPKVSVNFSLEMKIKDLENHNKELNEKLQNIIFQKEEDIKNHEETNSKLKASYEEKINSLLEDIDQYKKLSDFSKNSKSEQLKSPLQEEKLLKEMRKEQLEENYLKICSEFEEYKSNHEIMQKKYALDLKQYKKQIAKHKEEIKIAKETKEKLEKEYAESLDRIKIAERNSTVSQISPREKHFYEAMSKQIEEFQEKNELQKKLIRDLSKSKELLESQNVAKAHLLVAYASRYFQDHNVKFQNNPLFDNEDLEYVEKVKLGGIHKMMETIEQLMVENCSAREEITKISTELNEMKREKWKKK